MSERTFDNVKITSSFDVPETGGNLVSGETIGKHFGKIAKHMEDKSIHHTVDDVLSDTSENPVQNKIVKAELDKKADKSEIPTELPANGGNADSASSVRSINSKVAIFEDTEGGNVRLKSPDGTRSFEMDMRNNGFRMFLSNGDTTDETALLYDFTKMKFIMNGDINGDASNADTVDGKHASDFANAYNDLLKNYLSGQSGDIRTLVNKLSLGNYIFSTGDNGLESITFPFTGQGSLTWIPSKAIAQNLVYGLLIIRPLTSSSISTFMCTVYNTSNYTEWQEIPVVISKAKTETGSVSGLANGTVTSVTTSFTPTIVILYDSGHIVQSGFALSTKTNGFTITPANVSTMGTTAVKWVAFA